MAAQIINQTFAVGDRFEGMINGDILRVFDIHEPGTYSLPPYGIEYQLRQTMVYFVSELTGKKGGCDLKSAQRLLLRKVS